MFRFEKVKIAVLRVQYGAPNLAGVYNHNNTNVLHLIPRTIPWQNMIEGARTPHYCTEHDQEI